MVDAFFYGILLHPKILQRVISNDGSHLRICPALLTDFTRHKIKRADYPAMLPYSRSRSMFDHDLEPEKRSVRGSLVSGLTDQDIQFLDVFEGDEYTRERVLVHPLGPLVNLKDMPQIDLDSLVTSASASVALATVGQKPTEVDSYVWCRPESDLDPDPWMFDDFVRESAWKWIGPESDGDDTYLEVDRRRAMEGIIVRS